jgi:DNA-binding MarR family transcriptional regulator
MSARSRPENNETLKMARVIRRSVHRIARRLRAERSTHDLSMSKRSVLGRLFRDGSLTATDLAAQERIQPQSLTRLIADLEKRGLITRHQHESDRRQLHIEITPAGRELLIRDAQEQDKWLATAMRSSMTSVECELLTLGARLLESLADIDLSVNREDKSNKSAETETD